MLLILSLAAPGSPYYRLVAPLRHSVPNARPIAQLHRRPCSTSIRSSRFTTTPPNRALATWTDREFHRQERTGGISRHYSKRTDTIYKDATGSSPKPHQSYNSRKETRRTAIRVARYNASLTIQPSRRKLKALRESPPTMVLNSIHGPARNLYTALPNKTLQHQSVQGLRKPSSSAIVSSSLYTILAHQLESVTRSPWATLEELHLGPRELALLHSKGYSQQSVKKWVASLVSQDSLAAAEIFKFESETPPLFILLLFLRRKNVRSFALGTIMRHIHHRLGQRPISWESLKILAIRLLRHARINWPELIPEVASMFSAQAARIYDQYVTTGRFSPKGRSDITRFCNTILMLVSLPTSIRPLLAAAHQETAQSHVLRFMASCEPPLIVTRFGFRSVARNQLAHRKTRQEKEWAKLKGPSWPPWKEDRTALDEDKGYEFSASRASRVLHRMYEAGYAAQTWEQIIEVYAGWDIDMSPTIQTRTLIPHLLTRCPGSENLEGALWAARIRATRTRREAWACFLAHESRGPTHQDAYLAMFKKLHYPEMHTPDDRYIQVSSMSELDQIADLLLPGDFLEVLPEPKSPLHLVYLSEPVPTYEQLYARLAKRGERPVERLLAFLVETHPDFSVVLKLLESATSDFGGIVGGLLDGTLSSDKISDVPTYFLAAFIKFLCRFSRLEHAPSFSPVPLPEKQHRQHLEQEPHYLFEYAHAILLRHNPLCRPVWTVVMQRLLRSKFGIKRPFDGVRSNTQYRIVCDLVERMDEIGLDIDDQQFGLICTASRLAAEAALRGQKPVGDKYNVFITGSRRLRTLFHSLVGGNADFHPPGLGEDQGPIVPPHVPGSAELHNYVRALSKLRDYEGLYSFSSWITHHHSHVTARAHAQRGGPRHLFNTLVALRAAVEGVLEGDQSRAPEELAHFIRQQIEGVEEWGGWPSHEYVELYMNGMLKQYPPTFCEEP